MCTNEAQIPNNSEEYFRGVVEARVDHAFDHDVCLAAQEHKDQDSVVRALTPFIVGVLLPFINVSDLVISLPDIKIINEVVSAKLDIYPVVLNAYREWIYRKIAEPIGPNTDDAYEILFTNWFVEYEKAPDALFYFPDQFKEASE